MKFLKCVVAVLAGLITGIAISFLGDALVRLVTPASPLYDQFNDPLVLGLSLVVVFGAGVAGALVTFLLAPYRPMLLVAILAAISFLMSCSAAIVLWDSAPGWYHIAALVLVVPAALLGGRSARLLHTGRGV